MDKFIGKDIKNKAERIQFLTDNADGVEEKGYMKPFTPDEMQTRKEGLANTSIEIAEIEEEAKLAKAEFAARLKPLKEQRAQLVGQIKAKSEYVRENCFRFTDQEERMTAFYNADGEMIECRPATAEEMQTNLFAVLREQMTANNQAKAANS